MELSSWCIGILLGSALLVWINVPPASDLYDVDLNKLARAWDQERISPPDPYTLKHEDLKRHLRELNSRHRELVKIDQVGSSVEGREIFLLSLGRGEKRILLWSQMHGDEPTATCALLDLISFFGRHRQEDWVREILERYTLLMIPMLNPDGAERTRRRNAQGIDINRDARLLQTPEGKILKAVRDRFEPFLGFNLHNQNGLTTVGDTGRVATIALLAVGAELPPSVLQGEDAPDLKEIRQSTLLTRRVTAVLYEALSPFVYGHISRYDEAFNPRAFGDNLTLWGTPIVLIESGGNPAGKPFDFGIKLNFIGLLAALNSLSTGKVQNANPAVFDGLKLNSSSPIYDLLLSNAWLFTGTGIPLFRGDVAIRHDLRSGGRGQSIIADIGDLGVFSAHQTIDCRGLMVSPGLIGWDPETSIGANGNRDREYLERGFVTLLRTADWARAGADVPTLANRKSESGLVNWGFVVSGTPPASLESASLQLAEWLAAGGRGCILPPGDGATPSTGFGKTTGWFGLRTLTREEGQEFRPPSEWSGDPAEVLKHWTTESARTFGLPGRGRIAQGAVADLVIWSKGSGEDPPTDLSDCRPSRIIINGRVIELSEPARENHGRFLGGQLMPEGGRDH